MPSDLHEYMSTLGTKWLKRQGFGVVANDLRALGCRERADVVGFRSLCSAIIESKSTRADFLVDAKKPERFSGGIGLYRFYICPVGLIAVDELPPRWGLLYGDGNNVVEVLRPEGNLWPGKGTDHPSWAGFQHEYDAEAERNILYSISRRLVTGKSILK